MACLLVTQPLYSRLFRKPIATCNSVAEAIQRFTQFHWAVSTQVVSSRNDVPRTGNWKPMRSGILECSCHRIASALQQERPHCFDRLQTHSRRGAGGKNAKDKFFEKACVRSTAPHFVELRKPCSNVFSSRLMSGPNAFNSNELMIA